MIRPLTGEENIIKGRYEVSHVKSLSFSDFCKNRDIQYSTSYQEVFSNI